MVETYTASELRAHRILCAAGEIPDGHITDERHRVGIRRAADMIIELAARIQAERQAAIIDMLGRLSGPAPGEAGRMG